MLQQGLPVSPVPNLKARFELESLFYQGEYSLISLVVHNTGYSPAQNIQVRSISQKFRIDEQELEVSRAYPRC